MTDNLWLPRAATGVQTLKPYQPGKPISELEREYGISDSVKVASNENPLGCSPKALAAAREALEEMALYPDGGAFSLKAALSAKHDLPAECITLGNGSNDVLDLIARVFLGPGLNTVMSEYAFAVYPISSLAVGAELKIAPAKDYGHDLEAMRDLVDENTRVVWIANPNNPTGTWLARDELEHFLEELPGGVICVLDEAYVEYVGHEDYPDGSLWLSRFPNLIVTRTFSKAYGLASLRVGYGLCSSDIADLLNRVRQPFNVNSFALAAAEAALQDQEHIDNSVRNNREGMQYLEAELKRLGLEWIPSVGNFISIDLQRSGDEIYELLLREGVITRPVTAYRLPNHLRISIGLPEENQRLIAALEGVLA